MATSLRLVDLWTERRLAPLNLTDTETLNWFVEHCDQAVYNRPTPEYAGGWTLYCEDVKTQAPVFREAVCLAAAKFQEENE